MADYTSAAAIAAHLAMTFTPEQTTQANLVAHAVTVWIDHRTGRTWQAGAVVLDEHQQVQGTLVYLARPPVVSVEQLEWLSGIEWGVVDPAVYSLTDPALGIITVPGSYNGAEVRVDYTSDATAPPADLAHAATILAAEMLFTTLHPESDGLSQIAVGQNDISLHYAGADAEKTPAGVYATRVIESYRRVVLA